MATSHTNRFSRTQWEVNGIEELQLPRDSGGATDLRCLREAQARGDVAVSTALIFVAFGVHALSGGSFEVHNVKAMTVRTIIGAGLAAIACRRFRYVRAVRPNTHDDRSTP